jgi:threonine dehydratase
LTDLISLESILAARERVRPVLRPTPVDHSESISRLAGRTVLIKPEYRQRTGSFKIRGAFNRIAQLPPGQSVVAASAGNHAQGVALAASLTGRAATIFMPIGAALPKVEATRSYGATVRLEGEVVDECIVAAQQLAAETGAVYVPPFDDGEVIAGQGTIGLELMEEAPEAEAIVVPTGGGGLLAEGHRSGGGRRPDPDRGLGRRPARHSGTGRHHG